MKRHLLSAVLLIGLLSSSAWADETPDELIMPTDVGKVALQKGDCLLEDTHGFQYSAYATDNTVSNKGFPEVHLGCWKKEGDLVYIWFYNEKTENGHSVIATYKDFYFKP